MDGSGGKIYSFWAMYSLRMSFWVVPRKLVRAHALLLGCGDVHGPDDGCRRVDRHAGGDLVQRDAAQQDLHVLEGRNCHTALAELTLSLGGVSIVAHQGWQVEGDRKPGLPLLQQILEALVGLLGCAETSEHAHGPQLAAVQGGVHPARVGVLSREAQVCQVVEVRKVQWSIQSLNRLGGGGDK